MSGVRILVVEDEVAMARALADNLRIEGYAVEICGTAEAALERLASGGIALVVLDVMLPGMDGRQMLKALRRRGDRVPVLMLTALGGERETVRGLDAGADDYLGKPFGLPELLARVRALLRRLPSPDGLQRLRLGAREIDFTAACVRSPTGELALTPRECDILRVLASRPGEVCTRDDLIAGAGGGDEVSHRSVDMQIRRLRTKLEDDPAAPEHLRTAHGSGYRLVVDGQVRS